MARSMARDEVGRDADGFQLLRESSGASQVQRGTGMVSEMKFVLGGVKRNDGQDDDEEGRGWKVSREQDDDEEGRG